MFLTLAKATWPHSDSKHEKNNKPLFFFDERRCKIERLPLPPKLPFHKTRPPALEFTPGTVD